MNWLKKLLGSAGVTETAAASRHLQFLGDLGAETEAVQFRELLSDRKRAAATLEEEGWGPVGDSSLDDVALLHVLMQANRLTGTDWAAQPEEILEGFQALSSTLDLSAIPADCHAFGRAIDDSAEPGEHVGLLFPRIEAWAGSVGCDVINLNVGSDMYHFALVPPAFAKGWEGTHLSAGLWINKAAGMFRPE